jgi:hypothetical protein
MHALRVRGYVGACACGFACERAALLNQRATRMRHIVSISGLPGSTIFFEII